jgi:O-antigen/teichoic acid export membrane protein
MSGPRSSPDQAVGTTVDPAWLRWVPARLGIRLRGRTNVLAIIHNTGWLFADRAMRILLAVLVGAWTARYLGPGRFGEFAYVMSFVALFAALAQLGLDGVAVRDITRKPNEAAVVLGTVLRLRILAGFLCWGTAIAIMAILKPDDRDVLVLTAVAAGMLVFQAADTVDLWFQSQMQSRRTVVAKTWAYVTACMLRVALIVGEAPLLAFVAVGVAELAISAALLAWSYRRYPTAGHWRFARQYATSILRESAPYLVAALAVLVYMRTDQLMLRDMVNDHELGLYSAAIAISTTLHVIPMAICASISPMMARLRQNDMAGYERAMRRLFSLMWWTMIPLSALVAFLAPFIVSLLYGPAFAAATPMLSVHVFASVPIALGVAQSVWIVNEQRNMIALYRTLLGVACNIVLNLLLIPRYGGLGAAVAALVAQTVAALVSNAFLAPSMLRVQIMSLVQPYARVLPPK